MKYDKFTLKIELGNDAMLSRRDVARALRKVADRLRNEDRDDAKILDDNGNSVGEWELS